MLDISFIRDHVDIVKEAARKKHIDFDVHKLLKVDDIRKELRQKVNELRAIQNKSSKEIASASDRETKNRLIDEMSTLKKELSGYEEKIKKVMKEWQELMLSVPNIPDVSVPEGLGERDNEEIFKWGELPEFNFEPKGHIELMTDLGMLDLERGVKVHGFRGYFLTNMGAELAWALWNYARDFYTKLEFVPVLPPAIVRKEHFYGTGHLPTEAEDLYQTQDKDYLSGTAEVPMMAYHMDEVLDKAELPKRYLAFSPCYRREAGAHGKDTKGLIRVHEFYKLEQLVLCEASHAESERVHEELTTNTENFLQSLKMPYRKLNVCGGDLSASKVKQYELELWVSSQKKYLEVASSSYYHDFQARRFNIKYQDGSERRYVHSINNTAVPTPRILVSLVEHYQQSDGSIVIPSVLRPYVGGKEVIRRE